MKTFFQPMSALSNLISLLILLAILLFAAGVFMEPVEDWLSGLPTIGEPVGDAIDWVQDQLGVGD